MASRYILALILATCRGDMYDSLSPVPMRAPETCVHGCAHWSNLAADGNTRKQSDVNAKWQQGVAPEDADNRCAMPAKDPDTTYWCYCNASHDSSWGYCRSPETPIPEQINLQYPGQPEMMVAAFVTFNETEQSPPAARWGTDPKRLTGAAQGVTRVYVDPSGGARTYYMHFVKLSGLTPGSAVYYQVKSAGSDWSALHEFRALHAGSEQTTRLAIYGDMGVYSHNNMGNLKQMGSSLDAIVHLGDHAYNIMDNHGTRGDGYFNAFSEVIASVPWVPVLGNHEFYGDYLKAEHYSNQTFGVIYGDHQTVRGEQHSLATPLNAFVTMSAALGPGVHGGAGALGGHTVESGTASRTSRYYSVDLGLVHFVALDLNVYYFGADAVYSQPQLDWLARDLEAAAANRQNVPWIVVGSHYPIYCTSDSINVHNDGEGAGDEPESVGCWSYSGSEANITQVRAELEPLFQKFGVDIYIAGHEHNYESMWPILNDVTVGDYSHRNYSNPQLIADPQAPVHFVTGAGGAPSLDTFHLVDNPWTRKRLSAWGYGVIEASNATVLSFQQILNKDHSVFDTVIITKPNGHMAYPTPVRS